MRFQWDATRRWAWEEFGGAALGDFRNTRRAVAMVDAAMRVQGGTICSVFRCEKEREAAYDFLENERVSACVLGHAAADASAARSSGLPWVWVAVDGTSLTLTDKKGAKGFGSVGSGQQPNRGLKVISSLLLDPAGVVLGVGEFTWWARTATPNRLPGGKHRVDNGSRKLEEKETYHWIETIEATRKTLREQAPDTLRWWVIDREADSWALLHEACRDGDLFTIRCKVDRKLKVDEPSNRVYLRETLRRQPVLDEYELRVPESAKHRARTARMQVRACTVTLDMRRNLPRKACPLQVNALWLVEVGTTPKTEKPLDWVLFTNHPLESSEDLSLVIYSYTQRWRIEDFHRTWKSSGGCVENNQLRGVEAVTKWATLLASMAARVERLKLLARTEPDRPASTELSVYEIRAIRALKRRSAPKNSRIPTKPTIGQAVLWIAEIGGYVGKSSGGPPGTITIVRGLETVRAVALGMQLAEEVPKERS